MACRAAQAKVSARGLTETRSEKEDLPKKSSQDESLVLAFLRKAVPLKRRRDQGQDTWIVDERRPPSDSLQRDHLASRPREEGRVVTLDVDRLLVLAERLWLQVAEQ